VSDQPKCQCSTYPPSMVIKVESSQDPRCVHELTPESFTITYPCGTTVQMTDEQREEFKRLLMAPLN
jgi:hypothetical protein